jgi:hypothetical protein
LSLLPRSAPTRASDVYGLATERLKRYKLSNQQDDLEQSILGFTEAILSLPLPLPFPNIHQAFHSLTLATFLRAEKSKHPEDVKYSVIYLRYRRGLPHDVHTPFSFHVTSFLVSALAFQAEFELGDVDQDIEEMADLCDELLDSDISTDSLTRPIRLFSRTVSARNEESFRVKIPCEKVIGCLRRGIIRLPDPRASIVLAKTLFRRFKITVSDDDYNEGMAVLDKVINFRGPGDTPSSYQAGASGIAVQFSFVRFNASGKPEHLEQAIYFIRTLLDRLSLDHRLRDFFINSRSFLQGYRFDGTGVTPECQWETSTSESGRLPSFRDLTASLPELSVKPIPKTTFDKHKNALYAIEDLTDIADIEDGVNYCQQLISSYPDSQLAPGAHRALSRLLHRAFRCTNEIEYLNKAISAGRDSLNAAKSRFDRFDHSRSLEVLIPSLLNRLLLFKRREDVNETIQMLRIAAENAGDEFHRLLFLCKWASAARLVDHFSVSTAYDRAM